MTMTTCPCCGGPMDVDLPSFDGNTLHYHGRSVALRPHMAKVARMLLDRMPGIVRFDELGELWKAKGTYWNRGTLRTYTCNLRIQIAPLGLGLHVVRGAGYHLSGYNRHDKPVTVEASVGVQL